MGGLELCDWVELGTTKIEDKCKLGLMLTKEKRNKGVSFLFMLLLQVTLMTLLSSVCLMHMLMSHYIENKRSTDPNYEMEI